MNIFTLLNSLLFSKKRVDLNLDDESQFSLYMINRWMSMYSMEMLEIINDTSNQYSSIFTTKQEAYDWLYYLFPRLKFKKIAYIKKNKIDKDEKKVEDLMPLIAKNQEISLREVRLYADLFPQLT
jgi:hypothetical protein